jgi:isoleucyl-tRNA synthetase
VHQVTGELHPKTQEMIETVALEVEGKGIDAWFDLEPESLLGAEAADYEKVTDTLDVWFDSGVTHACVLARRDYLQRPADLYLEGSDQHRGWFQSSLMTGVATTGEAPYKTVLTHGFTVDAEGKKMSKSKGNVVSPQKVVKNLGADIIRLWVASSDYTQEMSVSDEILKRTADSYRRIRNTARYLLSNLNDFNPATDLVAIDDMLALDKWAVDRAYAAQQDIIKAYDEFNFHAIYQKVHNFCAQEMGSLYLDITKDRQYTMQENSLGRRSSQTAMFHILEALVRWIAPILSFTADELWEFLPGERNESVMLNEWYQQLTPLSSDCPLNVEDWNLVFSVREDVYKEIEEKRKETGIIKGGLTADISLLGNPDSPKYQALSKLGEELKFVFIVSNLTLNTVENGDNEIAIFVSPAEHRIRCDRCWHQVESVKSRDDYDGTHLCDRCVDNMDGEGESRLYA